ncbi:MAG: hypothetical protein WB424_02780 [Terracidiphilus sp.]
MMNPEVVGVFVPIVMFVMLFSFLAVAVWTGSRKEERQAFYKSETLRRITESSGEGAKAAMEMMREEERQKRIKAREGTKLGGLICLAVGVGTIIFLGLFLRNLVCLSGLIPALVGVAMLVYVHKYAAPIE